MFTTPCCLHEVKPYIKERLYELGYKEHSYNLKEVTDNCILTQTYSCYWTLNEHDLKYNMDGVVDCGTNEILFLAIAALRDDSDINQWFVDKDNYWAYSIEDDLTFLDVNTDGVSDISTDFHEATVEELIEHFKG